MTQPKLNDFCKEVFEANKLKGFDVSKENIGQTLMLVVSELCEALEADREGKRDMLRVFNQDLTFARTTSYDFDKGNENCDWIKNRFETTIKDTFEDEIADSFIRLMYLVGAFNIDIDSHIELKLKYNSLRSHKHGKAY